MYLDFLEGSAMEPIDKTLTSPEFTALSAEKQVEVINGRFNDAASQFAQSEEDHQKLFAAKADVLKGIYSGAYWRDINDSLPEDMRTPENKLKMHNAISEYSVAKGVDPLHFNPARFNPVTTIPLSESQVTEMAQKLKDGGEVPPLMPSELAKVNDALKAIGGTNFVNQALIDRMINTEDVTRPPMNMTKGVAPYTGEEFSKKAEPALAKLDAARAVDQEMSMINWRDVSDKTGPLMQIRRKPDVTGIKWQMKTPTGVIIEKSFDKDPTDSDFAQMARENIDAWRSEDASFPERFTSFAGKFVASPALAAYSLWSGEQSLSSGDQALRARVEEKIGGGALRSLNQEAGKIATDALLAPLQDVMAGISTFADKAYRYGNPLTPVVGNDQMPTWFSRTAEYFADNAKRLRELYPETQEQRLNGNWSTKSAPYSLVEGAANMTALVGQMFAAPEVGLPMLASQMTGSSLGSLRDKMVENGMDKDEAFARASTFAPIIGLTSAGIMSITGRFIPEGSAEAGLIENMVVKHMGKKATKGAIGFGLRAATSLPRDLVHTIFPMEAARMSSDVLSSIATSSSQDWNHEATHPILKGLSEWAKGLPESLLNDALFAGIASASKAFKPIDNEPTVSFDGQLGGFRALDHGGSSYIPTPRGVLKFDARGDADLFATALNHAKALHSQLTEKVNGVDVVRQDADPAVLDTYRQMNDKLNRHIESNFLWKQGQTMEYAASSHDTLVEAVDAVKALAAKLSPDSEKLPSTADQRSQMVESLIDHFVDTSKDWERERTSYLDALQRKDLPNAKAQSYQEKMDTLLAKSQDPSISKDDLDKIMKLWGRYNDKFKASKLSAQAPDEASANEWVASQKDSLREGFRDRAEAQVDDSFGPLSVTGADPATSKAIKQMLTIEPRKETGIGPDGVRWTKTRYDVILGDRDRAQARMANRMRFVDPFFDAGTQFHPLPKGSPLVGNLAGLETQFSTARRSAQAIQEGQDALDASTAQSAIGADLLREKLAAQEAGQRKPFLIDDAFISGISDLGKVEGEPAASLPKAKSAAASAEAIDASLTADERMTQSPQGKDPLKKKLTLERMNAARKARRTGSDVSAAESSAADAAELETVTSTHNEKAQKGQIQKGETGQADASKTEVLTPIVETIASSIASSNGIGLDAAKEAVSSANPESIKTSARKVIDRGPERSHASGDVEPTPLPDPSSPAPDKIDPATVSQATKDAIELQKGTSMKVWLSENNKLRPFTSEDISAILSDLGLAAADVRKAQDILHSQFAKPKKEAVKPTYEQTPEELLRRSKKDAIDEILDGEDGVIVDDLGGGITQREYGGETFWRNENAEPEKGFNTKSRDSRKNQRGSTIIFGELADLAISAIKKGKSFAQYLSEAVSRFGKEFTEAFKRTWTAVSRGTADVANHDALVKYAEPRRSTADPHEVLTKFFGIAEDSKAFEMIMRHNGASDAQIERVRTVRNEIERMNQGSQLTEIEVGRLAKDIEGLGVQQKWLPRYLMQPLHKAIGDIHPILQKAMLKYSFDEMEMLKDFTARTKGFHDELKKLSAEEGREFTYLTRTNDGAGLAKLLKDKPKLVEEWKRWKDETAPYIRAVAQANGLSVGEVENYFPTSLKEGRKPGTSSSYFEAFHDELKGSGLYEGPITEAIKEKELKLSRKLTADEIVDLSSSLLGRGGRGLSSGPGNAKARKVRDFSREMLDYYQSPADAFSNYVNRMPRGINQKRFFGVDPITEVKTIDAGEHQPIPKESVFGSIVSELGRNKLITAEEERHVIDMVRSVTQYKPTPAMVKLINAGNPFFALNNPVTGIKMLGHAIPSLWENGLMNTAMAVTGELGRAVGLSKNKFRFDDLGLPKTLDLLTGDSFMKPLKNLVWRANLFKAFDGFAGNITVNGWTRKMQAMSEADRLAYVKQYSPFLKSSAENVSDMIAKGEWNNHDVHFLAFSNLSQIRPTSLASLPRAYIDNPSLRLAYNLRTYMVHQADYWRDNSIGAIQRGVKNEDREMIADGVKGLFLLGSMMTASGAGFTMTANYILGKPGDWEDSLIDSMIHNVSGGMVSEYAFSQLKGKSGKITDVLTTPFTSSPTSEFINSVFGTGKRIASNMKHGEDWWRDAVKLRDVGRFLPIPWVNIVAKRLYWQDSGESANSKIQFIKGSLSHQVTALMERKSFLDGASAEALQRHPNWSKEKSDLHLWGLIHSRANQLIQWEVEHGGQEGLQAARDIAMRLNNAALDRQNWPKELSFLTAQLGPVKGEKYKLKHQQ